MRVKSKMCIRDSINDRGIIRVTMPGGEEQIFLTLRGGGYDSLADSGFVLENEADGKMCIRDRSNHKGTAVSPWLHRGILLPSGHLCADKYCPPRNDDSFSLLFLLYLSLIHIWQCGRKRYMGTAFYQQLESSGL